MLTSTILSAIFLASGSMAQYYGGGSGPSSSAAANVAASWTQSSWPSATSSGTVLVQVVQVSDPTGSTLRYYPEKVVAPPGSWVQFQFQPKVHTPSPSRTPFPQLTCKSVQNHTVTQSTFDNPCVPIHNIQSNVTGIKSGFMPVSPGGSVPVFSVLVNDTTPIWLYCGQVGHCQKGMALVINEKAGSNKTLEAYKAAAALLPVPGANATSSVGVSVSSSVPVSSSSLAVVPTSIPTTVPTSPTSSTSPTSTTSGPATFTGAANREVVGTSGLAGVLFAALAFVL
jgi:hypothetical protein